MIVRKASERVSELRVGSSSGTNYVVVCWGQIHEQLDGQCRTNGGKSAEIAWRLFTILTLKT